MLFRSYATLLYYPEEGIIHHELRKFTYGDALHEILEVGLASFQQHGLTKWLSDDRKNSAIPQGDVDWAMQYWISPMIQSGWKYWAVILPDKTAGKAAMNRVIEQFSQLGISIEVFYDASEAFDWLRSV